MPLIYPTFYFLKALNLYQKLCGMKSSSPPSSFHNPFFHAQQELQSNLRLQTIVILVNNSSWTHFQSYFFITPKKTLTDGPLAISGSLSYAILATSNSTLAVRPHTLLYG